MNNEVYKEKVKLLLQLMPFVMQEQVFAVHGGSAINLFVKDMPRYSVDIDLTYIPLADREESIADIEFTYEEFEQTRSKLITDVRNLMTEADKQFLLSFESAEPQWDEYEFAYFRDYPSVQWKLLNLAKLKKQNPAKLNTEVEKLQAVFGC